MTFTELCKIDETGSLTALLEEAGAFRVLFEDGRAGRTFNANRAALLRKDPNYCSGQLWNALPRERGEVGLKRLAENVIQANPALRPWRDLILQTLWDALPPCQHEIVEGTITRGHAGDYPLPPLSPEVLAGKMESCKRQLSGKAGSLLAMLREAAEKSNA